MTERIPMLQHQETTPRTRVTLLLEDNPRADEWSVWEIADRVPPSTALELEPSKSPDEPRDATSSARSQDKPGRCQQSLVLPGVVMEVSDDGEIVVWPGPEVT